MVQLNIFVHLQLDYFNNFFLQLMKKKYLFICLALSLNTVLIAHEGMWLPQLLKQLNTYENMQSSGLKLSAEDIYSVNNSSLKDAIVSFGGFCTAEVISSKGLILTNHHCGYGKIQAHSTPENDYVTNGFWAMKSEEELNNPGLTATFIIRIDDVTEFILANTSNESNEAANQKVIKNNILTLKDSLIKQDSNYSYVVKPFFYGNKYYQFTTETYKDVRLVGAPPASIGKFGGDTDNWMWPRHTGDFSVFRIYADSNNRPAVYSKNNVPFKPRHHLPVSLKGIKKGDFTMVFGFPGRTKEYLTSYAVEHTINTANPTRIKLRESRLNIMDRYMKADHTVWLKYTAKYNRISNYWKKWIGETRGLKKLNAIKKKRKFEAQFFLWSNGEEEKVEYSKLLNDFRSNYRDYNELSLAQDYLYEAGFAMEIFKMAFRFRDIVQYTEKINKDQTDTLVFDEVIFNAKRDALLKQAKAHYKDYHAPIDRDIVKAMLKMYAEGVPKAYRAPIFNDITAKGYDAYADELFSKSFLRDEATAMEFIRSLTPKLIEKKFKKDPAYLLTHSVYKHYRENVSDPLRALRNKINLLNRTYVKGIMEMKKDAYFYPDANSTLRITHGKIDNYVPRDGVQYEHFTTLKGIMEKGNLEVYDYVVDDKLKQLYKDKDYGAYADSTGFLPVCFTASNHTTGGNSGSPVIDANGNLIGLNFDRNWEGTMSDIMYDPDMCRNIAVDARYVLFIIDKFAGAGYLVEEMTLVK